MHRLMLLRHAKSDWSVGSQRDLDRPLAPRGRKAAPLVGAYMGQHALIPDRILVSTARRARETWELIAPALGNNLDVSYHERLYDAGTKALLASLREAGGEAHSLLVIGHNPGLQELAALLIASGELAARQQLLQKFPTAALAVLDAPIAAWSELRPHSARLHLFVTPRDLAAETD